jgi:SNF family Na+-dependent transporter
MGQNGGGTFLIAYFIALIVVVLPIMMLDRLIYRLISV